MPRSLSLAALVWALLFLAPSGLAQEQELLRSQAGRYALRAYLSQPAAVGPTKIVVELGPPTATSATPRTRPIRIGSPAGSPYAPPSPSVAASPKAQDFQGVAVSAALDMPDMPATKAVEVALKSTAPGRYEGDALLTMRGTWRILLQVSTPDGVTRKPVQVVVQGPSPASQGGSQREGLEFCSPEGTDTVPITVHCLPDPPQVGRNQLRIELPNQAPIPVVVGVTLPGLILGIPPTEAVRQDDGSYHATIHLPMAGYWQLRVDLNGQALPPFALNVEEPAPPAASRWLLGLLLVVLVPGLAWCALRRRDRLVPLALAGLPLVLVLGLGIVLEKSPVANHHGGMTMEMMAADMGLSHLKAPLPVLEAKAENVPLVVSKSYPGTVIPAKEDVILAPGSGSLTMIAASGSAVEAGEVLARLGQTEIKAPFRGVVTRALLPLGASVASGTPLLALTDTRQIAVRARAPVEDRPTISPGMPVQVADSNGQATVGEVVRLAATTQARTFDLEARLPGRKLRGAVTGHDGSILTPAGERDVFFLGQEVSLQLTMERLSTAVCVPRSAVRQSPEGSRWVFVVERVAGQRVARKQIVTLGQDNGASVQVISGLQAGQTVVARAESSLQDGDVVVPATAGEGVFRSLYIPDSSAH